MIILAIETSCDDTCVAILKSDRKGHQILANLVSSQVKIHAPYGGVVPTLAKREHQKNLVPLLKMALKRAEVKTGLANWSSEATHPSFSKKNLGGELRAKNRGASLRYSKDYRRLKPAIPKILAREEVLLKKLKSFLKKYPPVPEIDLVAVTIGPGLEPALWPGINLAKALAYVWQKPMIGINHIEGHIAANWLNGVSSEGRRPKLDKSKLRFASFATPKVFPAICLVVSGGHTQIILMRDFLKYKLLGETRDDAAGEAFDKVAKLLGLGYPGGPIISQRAKKGNSNAFDLPRPMLQSKDYDFSFSGLKTAVLYLVKSLPPRNIPISDISASFQQAVIDVLIAKTIKAAQQYKAKTIMLSGGVAANQELRKQFKKQIKKHFPKSRILIPSLQFCTDNAAMIALAAYFRRRLKPALSRVEGSATPLKAQGNLRIA